MGQGGSLTTCDHQSKRPEIRETGTPLGVSNKVGDLSPLVYIRKRAYGAFFGMHAFGAAFWLRRSRTPRVSEERGASRDWSLQAF